VRLGISSVVGVTLVVGVILVHDAFTYSERHVERVPINPLGLHPRRGGKKNLPILEADLDDEPAEDKGGARKPRLVIVGGGWGVSLSPSPSPSAGRGADVQ
jgi:NADH dehydrogenase